MTVRNWSGSKHTKLTIFFIQIVIMNHLTCIAVAVAKEIMYDEISDNFFNYYTRTIRFSDIDYQLVNIGIILSPALVFGVVIAKCDT